MKLTTLSASLLLIATAGCSNDQKLFGPSLMPRAQAAEMISDTSRRDDALRAVALDAVHDGDAVVANEAIDHMTPSALRDDVASRCALWLAHHWRAGEGASIAKKIGDTSRRDQTLAEIALGRP